MPAFDPIASPTVRIAPHREPAFDLPDQQEAARQKLAAYTARAGGRPILRLLVFGGVGGGVWGCWGGGVAVGAPTRMIDARARRGLRLTSCYPEPSCPPSRGTLLTGRLPRRHGLQRPPMYGEPG